MQKNYTSEAGAWGVALVMAMLHAFATAGILRRPNASFYLSVVLAVIYYLVKPAAMKKRKQAGKFPRRHIQKGCFPMTAAAKLEKPPIPAAPEPAAFRHGDLRSAAVDGCTVLLAVGARHGQYADAGAALRCAGGSGVDGFLPVPAESLYSCRRGLRRPVGGAPMPACSERLSQPFERCGSIMCA